MEHVLVLTAEFTPSLRRKLKALPFEKDNILVLTSNERAYMALKEHNYITRFDNEIIVHSDIREMRKANLAISNSAYTTEEDGKIIDHSVYDGISLNFLMPFYLLPSMGQMLRSIQSSLNVAEKGQYQRVIIVGESPLARAARLVFTQKNIEFQSWFSGPFHRVRHKFLHFILGARNQWRSSPVRDLFFEPIQIFAVCITGYLKQHLPYKRRQWIQPSPEHPCLVLHADTNIKGIYDIIKDWQGWGFMHFGINYRYRQQHFSHRVPIEHSLSPKMLIKTFKALIHLNKVWKHLNNSSSYSKRFTYKNISYWEIIRPLLGLHLLTNLPCLYLYYLAAKESLGKLNKNSIIMSSGDESGIERLMILAARATSIKSIATQHGVFRENRFDCPLQSDYYFTWGNAVLEWQELRAHKTSGIVITGSSKYDFYYHMLKANTNKDALREKLGLPKDKYIFLLLTVWGGDLSIGQAEDLLMMEAVSEALSSNPLGEKFHLVVKPHPTALQDVIQNKHDKLKAIFPDSSLIRGHLNDLLYLSDICVSSYSSTLLEATFFGKPIIVFDRLRMYEWLPYVSRKVAYTASDAEGIQNAMNTVFSSEEPFNPLSENYKDFIRYMAYKLDGKASERICQTIIKISEGKEPDRYS